MSRIAQHGKDDLDLVAKDWFTHSHSTQIHYRHGISTLTVPSPSVEELEEWYGNAHIVPIVSKTRERFDRLVSEWKASIRPHSMESRLAMHPAYQKMIGMGETALPFMFEMLKVEHDSPSHWFWALASITEQNPVPSESRGRVKEMAKAWMYWGENNGYVKLD